MDSSSRLQALSNLYLVTRIPLLLFQKDGTALFSCPATFAAMLDPGFLKEAASRCENTTLLISWDGLYHSACTSLGTDMFIITAPVSLVAHHKSVLLQACSDWIIAEQQASFLQLLSELPAVGQLQLKSAMELCRFVYGFPPAKEIQIWHKITMPDTVIPPVKETENLPIQQMHAANYESHVIAAIKNGDLEQLKQAYHRPMDGYVGRMSLNDLRQTRYLFICTIYFASRAAADGGVPRETCMQLSDDYCQAMDVHNNIDSIFALLWKALQDFCQRVYDCKDRADFAPSTRQCLFYIDQHIFETIRMEALVDFCQLNRRSISQYFKRDLGLNIPQYINRRKLEKAASLLTETSLSISQISNLLQFASQSYFGKLFAAEYQVTPNQYRAAHGDY